MAPPTEELAYAGLLCLALAGALDLPLGICNGPEKIPFIRFVCSFVFVHLHAFNTLHVFVKTKLNRIKSIYHFGHMVS
jgi:hypothetical protein